MNVPFGLETFDSLVHGEVVFDIIYAVIIYSDESVSRLWIRCSKTENQIAGVLIYYTSTDISIRITDKNDNNLLEINLEEQFVCHSVNMQIF